MSLKGKDTYTQNEIYQIIELIKLRVKASPSEQKRIRSKIRKIGFYGQDDWGISDLQVENIQLLISEKKIKIIGDNNKNNSPKDKYINSKKGENTLQSRKSKPTHLTNNIIIKSRNGKYQFNLFDPLINCESVLEDKPGNYIICLRKDSKLPKTGIIPNYTTLEGYEVIYTGITSKSLRSRDYKQHFIGNNAGRSTFRKSLGSLFGYKKIQRDKEANGKYKFSIEDEKKLSDWMQRNLILFFMTSEDYDNIEKDMIDYFNPPLNIKGNKNKENKEFRNLLSDLRKFTD